MDVAIYILGIAWFVFWAAMLINAAQRQKWVWFLAVLLVPPVALLFVFFGYESGRRRARSGGRRRGAGARVR